MSARVLAKLMKTVKETVCHRVNKILKLGRREDWGHCPGVENSADLGSEG